MGEGAFPQVQLNPLGLLNPIPPPPSTQTLSALNSSGTPKSYSLSTQHPNLVCTHLLSQFPPFPQVSPPEKMTLKSWAPLWTHPHPHQDCWKVEPPVIGIFKIPSSVSCTLVLETHCPFILPPAKGGEQKPRSQGGLPPPPSPCGKPQEALL